jgi:hypothetical protein
MTVVVQPALRSVDMPLQITLQAPFVKGFRAQL